jgi:hypothetical protein
VVTNGISLDPNSSCSKVVLLEVNLGHHPQTLAPDMKSTRFIRCVLSTALAGLVLTSGCNTVSIRSKQSVGEPSYAASNPVAIAILHEPPSRPFVRLGQIIAEPSSDGVSMQQIEAALQKAAAKWGANAIVIVRDRNQITKVYIHGPLYHRSFETVQGRVVIGVAIRYTDVAFQARPVYSLACLTGGMLQLPSSSEGGVSFGQ